MRRFNRSFFVLLSILITLDSRPAFATDPQTSATVPEFEIPLEDIALHSTYSPELQSLLHAIGYHNFKIDPQDVDKFFSSFFFFTRHRDITPHDMTGQLGDAAHDAHAEILRANKGVFYSLDELEWKIPVPFFETTAFNMLGLFHPSGEIDRDMQNRVLGPDYQLSLDVLAANEFNTFYFPAANQDDRFYEHTPVIVERNYTSPNPQSPESQVPFKKIMVKLPNGLFPHPSLGIGLPSVFRQQRTVGIYASSGAQIEDLWRINNELNPLTYLRNSLSEDQIARPFERAIVTKNTRAMWTLSRLSQNAAPLPIATISLDASEPWGQKKGRSRLQNVAPIYQLEVELLLSSYRPSKIIFDLSKNSFLLPHVSAPLETLLPVAREVHHVISIMAPYLEIDPTQIARAKHTELMQRYRELRRR